MMAIQDFNQPYEILWNTDNEGNPVTVLIQNETHTITDNMIVLGQIPSESIGSKPTITGKYEVPLNSDLVSASYFKVDYKSGLIYFHNSLEGTTITINQYYGRGIRRLMASRVKLEDTNNHYTSQTVEGALKEVYERVDNIITTPAGEITAQEIIDARKGEATLRNKIDGIDAQMAENTTEHENFESQLAQNTQQHVDINNALSDVEQQLAQKATKGEISVIDIDKNKGKFDQTYMTDEFLQQIAGNTPVNAIPATDSITSEKIVNLAITPEKTSFLKTNINLLDISKLVHNKAITNTGAVVDNVNYSLTDYINAKPLTEYTTSASNRVVYFDANFEMITAESLTVNAKSTFSTPVGTKYFRMNIYNSLILSAMISKGAEQVKYEPFSLSINDFKLTEDFHNMSIIYPNFMGWYPIYFEKQELNISSGVLELSAKDYIPSPTNVFSANYETRLSANSKKIYYKAEVMTDSTDVISLSLRIATTNNPSSYFVVDTIVPEPNKWYTLSGIFERDDIEGDVILNIHQLNNPTSEYIDKKLCVKNVVALDLADLTSGDLPDKARLDEFTTNRDLSINGIVGYTLLKSLDAESGSIAPSRKFGVKFETVEVPCDIDEYAYGRLSLIATKTNNYYNANNSPIQDPQDIGYLYVDEDTNKIYYSSGVYNRPEYLCDWNKVIASNTNCTDWIPIITKEGDIVFLYATPNQRWEPIVYPSGDYQNPIKVTTSEVYQPAGLTTSTGACVSWFGDFFIFGEYMVNGHSEKNGEPMRIWKVSKPYTSPENWKVVDTWYYSNTGDPWGQQPDREITHFHTVAFDHYTGNWYANTGDLDAFCRVLESKDDGETWNEVASNGQKWRTLGYIFTEDACYWGTDSPHAYHNLYKAERDANGEIDFSTTKVLTQLEQTGQRTYNTCLVREPYGLLLLDRAEPRYDGKLDLEFWSFEDNKLYNLGTFCNYYDIPTNHERYGFGNIACTYYQSHQENGIVCGGGGITRNMSIGILGNKQSRRLGVCKIIITKTS